MKQLFTFALLMLPFFGLHAQVLKFGNQIDKIGNLLSIDTVFRMNNIPHLVHAKMFYKAPLSLDTFLVVVKSLDGKSTKFHMKRSTSKLDAYALLKFKEDGIYKVFVVNPKTKATVTAKRIYITSAVNPTVASLKNHSYSDLAMKGKVTPNTTANTTKPNTTANTTKPNTTGTKSSKDDDDDDDDDDDKVVASNTKVPVVTENEKLEEIDENLDIDDVDYTDDIPSDDDDDGKDEDMDDND